MTTIENPVINSPFEEPKRHFKLTEDGLTNQIVAGRRKSLYFVPIPKPKMKTKLQQSLDLGIENEYRENELINEIREQVAKWRRGGYRMATSMTKRLLEHWTNPERERRLFFCQVEALETLIYLTEIAPKHDANVGTHLLQKLAAKNGDSTPAGHPVLNRMACKMATGSGKTVVMSMIVAWHSLNKIANPKDKRFTDRFLVVSPGITIKDRLRVLLPSDPDNYYEKLNLVPRSYVEQLGSAKIEIINYHQFQPRDVGDGTGLTKRILKGDKEESVFIETPGQVVARVCKAFQGKKNIIVLNDEAHHCYHKKPDESVQDQLKGDEKKEAEEANVKAMVWMSGLEAVHKSLGIKAVYDLSATPFFLAGSGWGEGSLFSWVVSDFSLTDAIESSIVKVPRVPVADNTADLEAPKYRRIWSHIGKEMPKGRRSKTDASGDIPTLPSILEGSLNSLYSNYKATYEAWQQQVAAGYDMMPPVFIVVCANTQVSKMVFDWIAGYEKTLPNGDTVIVDGNLPIFSNVERRGEQSVFSPHPNTLLVDSAQLESGGALTPEFKAAAAVEIEEFKTELRLRFPERSIEKIEPENLLREVMNTVGKKGKLGENIKCVVSVSMLTEGWDTNTVTHILGIRAFSTQLLCEQVIGRGLRRISYEPEQHTVTLNDKTETFAAFPVEYAEVYGVPFEFVPMGGSKPTDPKPPKESTHVYSDPDKIDALIQFPRLQGYRYEIDAETLTAQFSPSSQFVLTTKDLPTITENMPIIGESSVHSLEELEQRRENEVAFLLTKLVLEKYFKSEVNIEHAIGGKPHHDVKAWLFPQVLNITKQWLHDYLICKDGTFPQLLLLMELAHTATDRIHQGIVSGTDSNERLMPILQPYNTLGTTEGVSVHTVRGVFKTNDKSHLSHVICDSGWEKQAAQALEFCPQVVRYVKNITPLDFRVPYVINGKPRHYIPDFIVQLDDGRGQDDLLNLVLEMSGAQRDDKDAKKATMDHYWVPAVNNCGQYGRWAFLDVDDPYMVMNSIEEFLR